MITKQLKTQLEEQFLRFNNSAPIFPLSIDSFVNEFVRPLLMDPEARTLLTALYSFILEYKDRYEMLELRSDSGGTIEPFLIHLFKGALIYESILKHTNRDKNLDDLGKYFNDPDIRIKYFGDCKRDIFQPDLKNNLYNIIDYSKKAYGIESSFTIVYYVRNFTGHNLARQDEFRNPDDFKCLYHKIIDAILSVVAVEIKQAELLPKNWTGGISGF